MIFSNLRQIIDGISGLLYENDIANLEVLKGIVNPNIIDSITKIEVIQPSVLIPKSRFISFKPSVKP